LLEQLQALGSKLGGDIGDAGHVAARSRQRIDEPRPDPGLSHMEIPESKPALGPIPSLLFCCPSDLPRQTADILRWICAISGRTNRNRNATRLRNIASQRPRK